MAGKLVVLFFTLGWLGQALAQALEIIPLRHRTVEQVMPVLLPLLEPGGTLSGMQNQLFVRTGPKNLAELKQVLASIDTPLRRLLISVRQQSAGENERRSASVSGTIGGGRTVISNEPGGGANTRGATVRIEDARAAGDNQIVQQVQALEGAPAMIQMGQAVPLTSRTTTRGPGGTTVRESTTYGEVSSGFEVVARIAGDRAILEISPRREALAGGSGAVNVQRIVSTASGKLGEWFELGGVAQGASRRDSGIASRSGAEFRDSGAVWVKVEEIK